ncbi:hypothetical protein NDU88_005572 [Pleurodeles waltl]|uniref:Uncharacterized protein n=1 Tax=Pleurodeles waltl TaxID=8319 RepID=A0AAV7WDR6_PLEWA|nr:hypothetical protein NDU88_005572 [Pleurodeles waltl]
MHTGSSFSPPSERVERRRHGGLRHEAKPQPRVSVRPDSREAPLCGHRGCGHLSASPLSPSCPRSTFEVPPPAIAVVEFGQSAESGGGAAAPWLGTETRGGLPVEPGCLNAHRGRRTHRMSEDTNCAYALALTHPLTFNLCPPWPPAVLPSSPPRGAGVACACTHSWIYALPQHPDAC